MMYKDIVEKLPYKSSFLFVDNISSLNEEGVTGDYTLRKESFFYEDHFAGNPVTPGVIITEIMAQIGLVVLGIYLVAKSPRGFTVGPDSGLLPLLTSTDISFYKMVLPGDKVTVISKKEYFRFGKLKCQVEMRDEAGGLIAKGGVAGFIKQFHINKQTP
jgi:3-hydroxyacyl-[acyl-carrier-protein] dehydratase